MNTLKYVGLVVLGMLLWSALLNSYLVIRAHTEFAPEQGCTTATCWS